MTDCNNDADFTPADQPKAPDDDCKPSDAETPKPPELPKPPHTCPSKCKCPKPVATAPTCLDGLIAAQNCLIIKAANAKTFSDELTALLNKAKAAAIDYNQDNYAILLDRWKKQDADIAELTRKLTCSVKCWRCVIECYVCPYLKEMADAERKLYGTRTKYNTVDTLDDLLYWQNCDRNYKNDTRDRVTKVLAAWETPYKTLDKALSDEAKAISDLSKTLVSDGAKSVFDVIVRLIPRHLAIAPPASVWQTKIDKTFTEFCEFDTGTPDDCCGPDVGLWSLQQRLVGPLPYLVDPSDFFDLICCLVQNRYVPAKNAAIDALAAWTATDTEIKRLKALIDTDFKAFDPTGPVRTGIPAAIRCCGDDIADDSDTQTRASAPQAR